MWTFQRSALRFSLFVFVDSNENLWSVYCHLLDIPGHVQWMRIISWTLYMLVACCIPHLLVALDKSISQIHKCKWLSRLHQCLLFTQDLVIYLCYYTEAEIIFSDAVYTCPVLKNTKRAPMRRFTCMHVLFRCRFDCEIKDLSHWSQLNGVNAQMIKASLSHTNSSVFSSFTMMMSEIFCKLAH